MSLVPMVYECPKCGKYDTPKLAETPNRWVYQCPCCMKFITEKWSMAEREKAGKLVLTIKAGKRVFIGDNIEIKVESIGEEQVRISFICPPEIKILREELKPHT
jgi:carbon storage regulator CsrA